MASGTTSEQNATEFFQSKNLKVSFLRFDKWVDARAAYALEKCDVFTGDRSALAAERSLLPAPQNQEFSHVFFLVVISGAAEITEARPLISGTPDILLVWTSGE